MPDITFLQSQSNSAFNGGNITITFSSATAGTSNAAAVIVAVLGTSRATSLTVTTSSGGAYTQIGTTTNSSYARVGFFTGTYITNGSYDANFNGSGGSSDSTLMIGFAFDNIDQSASAPISQLTTTGFSTTPDSPSFSPTSSKGAAITTYGAQVNSNGTAPSSWLDALSISRNDTLDASGGMAWITWNSTSALDPDQWTAISPSAAWVSATIFMQAIQDQYLYQQLRPLEEPQFRFGIVGY